MALEQGKNWLWYLNTGTIASPTWTLISKQKDGNVNFSNNFIDTTTKDNAGWTSSSPSTRDMSTDITCFYDKTDSTHDAIMDAVIAQTLLQFRVVGASGEHWTFQAYVEASLSAPSDNMVEMSVTFKRYDAPVHADA